MRKLIEKILSDYRYNPDSGEMIRVKRKVWDRQTVVNQKAGTLSHGYLRTSIRCDGEKYSIGNHRLAFVFMTGKLPNSSIDVDHINGIKTDNRWSNLRLAKRGQNNMNSGNPSNNTSGQKGVHRNRDKGWYSRIKVNQEIVHLGCFVNFEDAVSARKEAETKYFGEFSRTKVK